MRHKLTITIFADDTGREQETWHALLTCRGHDRWIALAASWVGEAEAEVAAILTAAPGLCPTSQPLRWSLAPGSTQPMEGQVAEVAVLESFTLADVTRDRNREAA